ncbi:VOC family protein [Nocardioides campestrisoli]|uniref:VOC family protein n=1 Tax=Nocardioides campestrisoli TaxID=2736757 RepID=UPI00163D5B4E|nr:VOC family protein [Nocardioides campestrisoli]
MTLRLGMVNFDALDPAPLARWWADQVGGEVADPYDGSFLLVTGGPVTLAFQQVDDPTPGKNKIHLDLTADDLDAEVDRLLGAGATLVERRGDDSFRWVTLADPDGNEFCVAGQEEAEASAT